MNSFYIPCGDLRYEEDLPEDVEYYIEVEWEHEEEDNSVGLPEYIDWFVTLHIYGEKRDITYDLSREDERYIRREIQEQMEESNGL